MTDPSADVSQALTAALERLLVPLAQLMVEQGVPYAQFDELMRIAIVRAAHAAHPGLPEHRRASRVSATTGLHRREVQRLLEAGQQTHSNEPVRSPALEVFAHWLTSGRHKTGKARRKASALSLPRTGDAPSFQSLAQEVTRDVHPRALLEELLRLKLVQLNAETDEVTLTESLGYTPRGDRAALLRYLGLNVGDHLQATVNNVLGRQRSHVEQSLAADGLSAESLVAVRNELRAQWQRLAQDMVPLVEQLIEADQQKPDPTPRYRLRLGVYGYDNSPDRGEGDAAPASSQGSSS
jgi:Family of unknown function (DUF6502)